MLNPELQRNLWLEFSPQRLLVMPLILLGLFYLAYQSDGLGGVQVAARWVYLALALLWGTRLAGDAVSDEVQARTWDWQRLSSLGAWTLTWGKLLGAPAYAWYGALMALLALLGAALMSGGRTDLLAQRASLLLLAVLCAHAVALLVSLYGVRRRDSLATGRSLWALLAGLLAALPWLGLERDLADGGIAAFEWYDRHWVGLYFGIGSALVFTALAWLACYRSMRAELQQRNAPWVWLAGLLFLMAYVAGFFAGTGGENNTHPLALLWWSGVMRVDPSAARLLVAMMVALLLCYFMALWEPKSRVLVTRLRGAVARGEAAITAALLPRWCYAMAVAVITGVASVLVNPGQTPATPVLFDLPVLVAAVLLFAVRDLALLVLLHLAPNPRRADIAWITYLFVLYLLAPALVAVSGVTGATAWFVPRADLGVSAGVLPVMAQAVLVLVLVMLRWRPRAVPQAAVAAATPAEPS